MTKHLDTETICIIAGLLLAAVLLGVTSGCSSSDSELQSLRREVESLRISVNQNEWKANKLKEIALDHSKEFGKVYDQMGEIVKPKDDDQFTRTTYDPLTGITTTRYPPMMGTTVPAEDN